MAFPNGWTRSCPMVIQHTQVTGSLTDYPVAINHASFIANCPEILTTGDANAAQADGGDIRFSSDVGGCVQLPCEVVDWTQNATPSLATAEIHVGGTAPDSAGDVTIYPWWKAGGGKTQPAATDPFGARAVWPSSHRVVHHFGSSATFSGLDSTGNYGVCTPSGGASVCIGKLGGGIGFANNGQMASLDFLTFLTSASRITLSLWCNLATYLGQGMCMFTCGPGAGGGTFEDINLMLTTSHIAGFGVDNGNDGSGYYTLDPRGVWHQFVLVFDGTLTGDANRLKVYDQGVQQSLTFTDTVPATTPGPQTNYELNHYNDTTWSSIAQEDEFRGLNVALSADWIATEYANQNSPGTFIIAGTPYTVSSWHCGGADPWLWVMT
jgi:hypothetical protein